MTISRLYNRDMFMKVISVLLIVVLIVPMMSNVVHGNSYANRWPTRKEISVFLAGALVGGVFYDGVKAGVLWGLSALTPTGVAALLAIITVGGMISIAAYMKNESTVDYVKGEAGCILTVGGHWMCPYGVTEESI